MFTKKGFTLIELLVVVLIIGILAAIAVPYYQESVEKSIMQEAIVNLKTIAQANDVFFLQNGRYANADEISKLDISIPGKEMTGSYLGRIETENFVFSPQGSSHEPQKALAQRKPITKVYYIFIDSRNNLVCTVYSQRRATVAQIKLCNQINTDGHL